MGKQEFYIHIGAPRTGSSFLRRNIFPGIQNVEFTNKQITRTPLTDFISCISHFGDGDELSSSISLEPPIKYHKSKVLISEEHLIWSVYHMMGNVGSRALLLKKIFPEAKILITIRRQPEYFISIFRYSQELDNTGKVRQMKTIYNMLNLGPVISDISISKKYGIPCGIRFTKYIKTYPIDKLYFNRYWRHFITADLSWYRLYTIYSDLFGKENVIIIPQEIWLTDPSEGIRLMEDFFQEKIQINDISFSERVNKSTYPHPFDGNAEKIFKNMIMYYVSPENRLLDKELCYIDMKKLGYYDKSTLPSSIVKIGLEGNKTTNVSENIRRMFSFLYMNFYRLGFLKSIIFLLRKMYTEKRRVKYWMQYF